MPPADGAHLAGPSRALPRALVIAAAALLIARVATGIWDARHAPPAAMRPVGGSTHVRFGTAGGTDRVAWVPIAQAEELAKRTARPILYDFSAEWCGPCRKMADEVFADPEEATRIGQLFVPVRVTDRQREDGRNPLEVDRLQQAYGIDAFPTLVVASPGRQRFEKSSGYFGRDATIQWLAQAAMTARMRGLGALPDSTPPVR